MRGCYYALFFLICSFAFADTDSISKTSIKQDSLTSSGKFHGLTRKCVAEESDEIETTPGSPPLSVDDPATPGCNNWEINVVMDGDLTRQEKTYDLPLLDINYGLGDNVQLKYEVPNVVSNGENSSTTNIGDSKFGIKYQFYGDDDSKLQFAVYPQVQFASPGKSSAADAPESRGTITTLPVLMSKRIGKLASGNLMMSANLGYNISTKEDTANFISGSVGFGAPLYARTSILAALVTEQAIARIADDPREQVTRLDVGLVSPLGKRFLLFGAVGKSLVASDERDHTYFNGGFRVLAGD